MSLDASTLLSRFATGHYKPATFLERGAALPFTTAYLQGGRIRPGERGHPELVLANPAGGEGVYVIPWSALPEVCAPTMHDRALWTRVAQLQMFTPRAIRECARGVAAEGFAGREAATAAIAAARTVSQHRVVLHYQLLLELIRQGEPPGTSAVPPERDSPTNVERRSRAVLDRLRRDGTMSATAAVEALEELAMAFDGAGFRHNPTGARLPSLCTEISKVMREVQAWGETGNEEDRICARLLCSAAELTLRCGRFALAASHALLDGIWTLLHRWRQEPEPILALVSRPEWVLDGWEMICGLWRSAEPAARGTTALDMATLVPMIPNEVRDWMGFDGYGEMEDTRGGLRRWRRMVLANHDWQTGRLVGATSRSEAARAIAA